MISDSIPWMLQLLLQGFTSFYTRRDPAAGIRAAPLQQVSHLHNGVEVVTPQAQQQPALLHCGSYPGLNLKMIHVRIRMVVESESGQVLGWAEAFPQVQERRKTQGHYKNCVL